MKNKLSFLFIAISFTGFAQFAMKNTSGRGLTFKEIQQQFATFKNTHDLSQEKGWKSFKRWEHETQMHTNAHGEPDGYKDYIDAALEVAQQKQQAEAASIPANWSPTGPNVLPTNLTGYMENGIGRINCIAFHPTQANTYFVGVAQGGLWKTTNAGTSWTPLTDNLPITRISDICIDPTNPNTMYISVCDFEYIGVSLFINGRKRNTHYGMGIYKTTDGGVTWTATGLTFQLTNGDESLIRKIVINPANNAELVACGVSGMYKSTNGGTNWTKKLDSLFWDMKQDFANPNVLYASTGWVASSNIGDCGIYKSVDFGTTWVKLNTGIPATGLVQGVKLAISPSDPNYVYACATDNSGVFSSGLYGFYKSTNAGATWTFIPPALNILEAGQGTGTGGQGTYDLGFIVHPTQKNTVYVGGVNLWGSTDGAANFGPCSHWTLQYGATCHGDIHFLAYNPLSTQYFLCSDGGVYRTGSIVIDTWATSAWPTVWTKMNDMQITSFYKLSSSKNATVRLVAGAQDNATFYYKAGAWSTIMGGDGMDNYLDPLNANNVIGSSQYGNFMTSTNNGFSSNYPNTNPNTENAEWTTPIVADYNIPGVLYIGNENLMKSTNNGANWSPLATFPASDPTEVSAIAVANTNSSVLYAAKRVRYEFAYPGAIYKSINGGGSWTNITAGVPDSLYYTGIEVAETNSNTAYVCMAGFSAGRKVYTTTNGGTTWTNISYNLPNIPVNCIKQIPSTNNLIVATDLGIYTLASGSTTWVNNSLGLPNVIISDIEFNVPANKVFIATFGRGIWETSYSIITDISNNQKTNSLLSFNLYPTINKGEFTMTFDNGDEKYLEIIDVMGRMVYSQKTKEEKISISINLAAGAYYARMTSGSKLGVKKFIVE